MTSLAVSFSSQPSRPSRPSRGPNAIPTLWSKDLRVNTLVSNHGIGTAGEPGIAVVPDGVGGSFVVWEDASLSVIRTQRLSANGTALWAGGIVSTSAAYQASPRAVTDGRGGVLVAWVDGRNGWCDSTVEIDCTIYIQRLDANGNFQWGEQGLPVTTRAGTPAVNRFAMISDGTQGAYLAWNSSEDYRTCCSYYLQHVGADGTPLWAINGIRVSEVPTVMIGAGPTGPRLVSDGAGGAILSWWNTQSVERPAWLMAQRVDAAGNFLWASNGLHVTFAGSGRPNYDATPDGAGGAIFAVQSNDVQNSANSHIYLQRISAEGVVMWDANGTQISQQQGAQITPAIAGDGQGGAFVAWSLWDMALLKNNRVSVTHVDNAGHLSWPSETAVTATTRGQTQPIVASDSGGGVIVGWNDCRGISGTDCIGAYHIYAQRIGRDGLRIWAAEGFPVSVAAGNQGVYYGDEKRPGYEMVPSGNGAVTFVWPDGRLKPCGASIAGQCDLYAQHLVP